MKTYIFEVQNLIKVKINSESVEEARRCLINNLHDYADEMIEDCTISEGKEGEEK